MTPVTLCAHLLALLSVAAPQTSPARRPGDLFAEIFQRGVVKQRTMKTIRASFTETTTSTLLVKPIVAHGKIIAVSPGRMRMTYSDPEPKILTMDGRFLTIAWPERRQREQIDIRDIQKRIDQYFTSASLDELRKLFDITAEPDPTIRRADRVEMRPKRKQIKQGLERLELWIERESSMLVQMRLSFPSGDQKTIALDDIVVDVPVPDDTFQIQP